MEDILLGMIFFRPHLNTVAFLFFLQGMKVESLLLEKYLYFFLELFQLGILLLV